MWTRDSEHHAAEERVELLIILAWRTEVEGDLIEFIFGVVEPSHRQMIVWELTIPFAQLIDDLPLDIVSRCDESPIPHVLSRRLTPYLQWSACLEDRTGGGIYPLRAEYLNPREIIDVLFFQPRTAVEETTVAKEAEVEDESEEETSDEEGNYSEYSEEEEGAESEEQEEEKYQSEEEEGSEWETLGEEADRTETREEDSEAAAWRRKEIAAGKQPLEYASGADLPIPNDPTKDPEPPKNDDGDPTAETLSALARRRRSRSPSPSPRPRVRTRVDAGHRASMNVDHNAPHDNGSSIDTSSQGNISNTPALDLIIFDKNIWKNDIGSTDSRYLHLVENVVSDGKIPMSLVMGGNGIELHRDDGKEFWYLYSLEKEVDVKLDDEGSTEDPVTPTEMIDA
ncbi:hypothetical protein CBR_g50180 [Chara braunii]|uniref:Uncharacterized protein n=1 Tax=Chara braunii TaxID=69332 RepID=A0A388M666_CHABU|nr:hypothetical protein CBR_g50180 [Chara braunii]|eukprot:GBG90087.1 hypothetical protein CBR_g50180 [Chara braunii]